MRISDWSSDVCSSDLWPSASVSWIAWRSGCVPEVPARPPKKARPKAPRTAPHKILLAIAVGTAGGFVAQYFGIPLAWMLGAMISTTVAAVVGLPVALPMVYRTAMIGVLGVMLGGGFAPEILARIGRWAVSLTALAGHTLGITGLLPVFLPRLARLS